jgi:hypothetical protein
MKITIESTEMLVHFQVGTAQVPARIWEGETDEGIPVHCYVTRICPSIPIAELTPEIEAQFQAALKEQAAPTAALQGIPLRMIL